MLEVGLDSRQARSDAARSTGRIGWQAIDQDVEARTDADYVRPRPLRERLLSWLIEYNKY